MESVWKLRRISIGPAVKIGCTVSCAVGFIIGTIWGIVVAFFSSMITMIINRPNHGLGALAVIIMPFVMAAVYAVIGAVLSFLLALFYNIAAGIMGGIEFEMGFERKEDNIFEL